MGSCVSNPLYGGNGTSEPDLNRSRAHQLVHRCIILPCHLSLLSQHLPLGLYLPPCEGIPWQTHGDGKILSCFPDGPAEYVGGPKGQNWEKIFYLVELQAVQLGCQLFMDSDVVWGEHIQGYWVVMNYLDNWLRVWKKQGWMTRDEKSENKGCRWPYGNGLNVFRILCLTWMLTKEHLLYKRH